MSNQYGHLRGKKKDESRVWRLAVAGAFFLWSLSVFTWNASRIGDLLDHHPSLGKPLGQAFGHTWYGPWKILAWGEVFREHGGVTRLIDLSYLLGVWLPVFIFLAYWRVRSGLKGREDLHGSARWADRKDIERMGYLEGEGVYVGGWWDDRNQTHYYLRHNGPEHILCFAPTRSGKGVGLILPTLLAWPHSTMVLDIKGENFALTSGWLNHLGHKVLRFDPSDAEGTSAAFNPLAEIRLGSPLAIPDVQQVASIVMDPQGRGLEDYWGKAAFGFFGGALLHCLIKTLKEQGRQASLYDVAVMLEDPARPVKQVFDEMLNTDHAAQMATLFPALVKDDPANPYGQAAHVFVASAAQGMLSKAEQELSGVVNTATSNLALYKDPIVARNISRCDFHLNDLMNHKVPVNLYLVISPADIDRLRPLLRIFVAQVLGRLTEKMDFEDGAGKPSYRYRLLLMLDEFTSLGKLAIVERAIAYMAGYGVKGYFIVQDTKQLAQTYGQDNALMANCHIRIAYAPNLPETAEYLSKMAGTTTVVDQKVSISGLGGRGGAVRSLNMAETLRPLLTPDECLRLPGLGKDASGKPVPGDMLIFTAGHPPIYGRQILYFLDPVFSKRAKFKAPGVAQGFSRGLSDSLYFTLPFDGRKPPVEPDNQLELPKIPEGAPVDDFAAEYNKLLAG
jgi:type IV secretion system protein VirD4